MRISSKILGITFLATALGLGSCTNELNEPTPIMPQQGKDVLVKAPKLKAWSGKANFDGTTRAGEVEVAPITAEEIEAAKAYFNSCDNWAPIPTGTSLDIEYLSGWRNYYVQNVTEGNKIPIEVAQYVGTNNEKVSNISIWNMDADEVFKLLKSDDYETSEARLRLEIDSDNDPQLVTNHPIKEFTFETTGYDINMGFYEHVRSSGHSTVFGYDYRIATLEGYEGVYVALYGFTNSNNGYWDRIIKLTKVDLPDMADVEEEETDGEIKSDKILHNNEVEVNLSLLDVHENYDVEDLISKLSIHVRHAGDVKVRIPVPVEKLVPADDLDIVLSHPELLESYGKDNHAAFMIGNNLVELSVDFTEAQDCAGNGYGYYIEVTTKGINKEVIAYCQNTFGDGVNFEVWNYYQWNDVDASGELSRRQPTAEEIMDLKCAWLDSTTIEFGYDNGTWNAYIVARDYPYYFINAFNNDRSRENAVGTINDLDCYVHIIGNQDGSYEKPFEGAHLNGSAYNIIYVRDDIYGTELHDDAHRDRNPKPDAEPAPAPEPETEV